MKILGLAMIALFISVFSGNAGQDGNFTYQGKLVQGTNLVNGAVAMKLRIYTNDVGGAFIYEESNTVVVVDGYYSFLVGKQPNYGQLKKALKHPNPQIEIEVDGEVLHPRDPFNPPPFADTAAVIWRYFYVWENVDIEQYDVGVAKGVLDFAPQGGLVVAHEFHEGTDTNNHTLIAFPPTIEPRVLDTVHYYFDGRGMGSGPWANSPSLVVQVRPFQGPPKRQLSAAWDIKSAPTNQWVEVPITAPEDDLQLGPDECLVIQFNHNHFVTNESVNLVNSKLIMWQIRVK